MPLAAVAENAQQLARVHALLLGHGGHVEAHVHEELHATHLLAAVLVPHGGAGGVAVGPGAAVHQVHGAAPRGRLVAVPGAVHEAAVPAVQSPRQRGAFHLHVQPVAAHRHTGALLHLTQPCTLQQSAAVTAVT